MDYYDHDDRKRDRHREHKSSSEHKKSKSSHKSHKQQINEYLGETSSHKRSRSRSKSKSRERSDKHHKHHHYHKSHGSSSETSKQNQKYEENQSDLYKPTHYAGTPSSTVMLRQLPLYITETDLRAELTIKSVPFRECRLVKSRETGASRGFAFIEFDSIEEAQSWLEESKGYMSICESRAQLYYSQPKYDDDRRRPMNAITTDWDCFKCGIKNFKRRDCCFKCSTSREDSEKMREGEGYDHVGVTPCNTLLLRGLDALSAEETIRLTIATVTNIYPKNVHIAKDSLTSISSGFGFIELNSIQEATLVLHILQGIQPFFEIDGKQINVDYSKNNYTTAISQVGTKIMYPLSTSSSHNTSNNYDNHYVNSNRNKGNQADQANSAAAVAQAALKNMQKKQDQLKSDTNGATLIKIKAYVTPDVSTYTYDEVSGYYYDSITGYYYDVTSQYYYNSQTQQYMYWDAASFSYVIVNNEPKTSTTTVTAPTETTYSASYYPYTATTTVEETKQIVADSVESENKKAKETSAAEIAKKMEKWAESMNKKKKPQQQQNIVTQPTPTAPTVSNLVVNEVSKKKDPPPQTTIKKVFEQNKNEQQPEVKMPQQKEVEEENKEAETKIVEIEKFDEKKFIDYNKMACLLCKRGFDSVELLNKHVLMSALHKTNLEKLKQENNQVSNDKESNDSLLAAIQYRDRAKERRDKYGTPEPPFKSDIRDRLGVDTMPEYVAPVPKTQKTELNSEPKSNDSFGSKLMKKFGWSEGTGLGKKNQGISVPIEASVRQRGLGLGASGVEFDPNDTYKECVKKSARARFESLKN